MNKLIFSAVSVLLLLSAPAHCKTGTLFMIGGGPRPDYLMQKFISLSGGPQARIIILPMASEVPLERALDFKAQMEKIGAKNVDYIICSSKTADSPENLQMIKEAGAIFITGGDQNLFMEVVSGTKLLDGVRKLYLEGGTIGGTSAGAAVMSKVMITGNDLTISSAAEQGSDFTWIKPGMVETAEGLGFISTAIVDQHFLKKKRFARLISLVLTHPLLYGIGVDESTAAIIGPEGIVEVFGESSVVILDARTVKAGSSRGGVFSAAALKMHILADGDTFIPATGETGKIP